MFKHIILYISAHPVGVEQGDMKLLTQQRNKFSKPKKSIHNKKNKVNRREKRALVSDSFWLWENGQVNYMIKENQYSKYFVSS